MPKTLFHEIGDWQRKFIERQQMFFVGTAARDGRVNIAPKDSASLRIMGPSRIVWVNLTGAENETGAHLADSPRMTLMWCSFDKTPAILRAYGHAALIHRRDAAWSELIGNFPPRKGARQIIDLQVDMLLKSCGFGVPLYEFVEHRDTLRNWEERKGEDGIRDHWQRRNLISLDGKPTGLIE